MCFGWFRIRLLAVLLLLCLMITWTIHSWLASQDLSYRLEKIANQHVINPTFYNLPLQMHDVLNSTENNINNTCNYQNTTINSRFLQVGNLFVYSAYLDLRMNDFDNPDGEPTMRIVGLRKISFLTRDNLYCVFHADTGQVISSRVQYYHMVEDHSRPWGGEIMSCKLPPNISSHPCHVDVVILGESSEVTESVTLPVQPTNSREHLYKFGVCVPPMYGHINPHALVEFVELSLILGAEHITMYDYSLSGSTQVTLQYYITRGLITLQRWRLPLTERRLWYFGQMVAIQDCLYRNMASTEYLLFNDLDEFIMPYRNSSWKEMMDHLDSPQLSGFQFPSAFFDKTECSPARAIVKYAAYTTIGTTCRSETISSLRTKCMVKPQKVFEIGIHHISKPITADLATLRVHSSVALIHHYRFCAPNFGMSCKDFVEDQRALLHAETLYQNVEKTIAFLIKGVSHRLALEKK